MISIFNVLYAFEGQKVYRITDKSENIPDLIVKNSPAKVVIVYESNVTELISSQKEMLDKLVRACKFSLDEAVYLNLIVSGNLSFSEIYNRFSPELVLVFGEIALSRNLVKLKKNVPYQLNGVKVLQTETLLKLDGNDKEKNVLWNVLKKIVNV